MTSVEWSIHPCTLSVLIPPVASIQLAHSPRYIYLKYLGAVKVVIIAQCPASTTGSARSLNREVTYFGGGLFILLRGTKRNALGTLETRRTVF